jgi:hypothetical protein
MQFNKLVWASVAALVAVALTSCNIGKAPVPTVDANAIYTSAAQTMIAGLSAQQTQTAAAASPTASPTPLGSPTALPTFAVGTGSVPFGTPFTFGTPGTATTPLIPSTLPAGTGASSFPVGCNDATYIGETKPFDKAQLDPDKKFDKGFSLQNTGTCTWDIGYSFNFKDGDRLSSNITSIVISDKVDFTAPGHSQSFILHMIAPKAPGEYKSYWQMRDDVGTWFGSIVFVDIVVVKPGSATKTPKP